MGQTGHTMFSVNMVIDSQDRLADLYSSLYYQPSLNRFITSSSSCCSSQTSPLRFGRGMSRLGSNWLDLDHTVAMPALSCHKDTT